MLISSIGLTRRADLKIKQNYSDPIIQPPVASEVNTAKQFAFSHRSIEAVLLNVLAESIPISIIFNFHFNVQFT